MPQQVCNTFRHPMGDVAVRRVLDRCQHLGEAAWARLIVGGRPSQGQRLVWSGVVIHGAPLIDGLLCLRAM